jgi:hypothetical protein
MLHSLKLLLGRMQADASLESQAGQDGTCKKRRISPYTEATLRAPREGRFPLPQARVVALADCYRSGRVAILLAAEPEEQQAQPRSPRQRRFFAQLAPAVVGYRAELTRPESQKKSELDA